MGVAVAGPATVPRIRSGGDAEQMETTRDTIVRLLAEHPRRSAGDLAKALGLSVGSVRRHVDILLADGLLGAEFERQPRGRPVTRYSLSREGEERSGAPSYSRLLERIYPALAGLEAAEIAGSDGSAVLDRVFHRVAEEVAQEHRPRVTARELGERRTGGHRDTVRGGDTPRRRGGGRALPPAKPELPLPVRGGGDARRLRGRSPHHRAVARRTGRAGKHRGAGRLGLRVRGGKGCARETPGTARRVIA